MSRSAQRRTVAGSGSGWRMPAEWEPHEATWLAWPHSQTDWPGKLAPIPWVYGEIVRKLAPGELVRILVGDGRLEGMARRVLCGQVLDTGRVEFVRLATDRAWIRDYGPLFVRRTEPSAQGPRIRVAGFGFNGWAKYRNWRRDVRLAQAIAKRLGVPHAPVRRKGRTVILEGGSLEVNGQGTLLTTEECLLDPQVQVRNPGWGRREYEALFREELGIGQTIWLGRGLSGDDTHGHVDDLCRFVNPSTVVLCQGGGGSPAEARDLAENRERLQNVRLHNGAQLEVLALPLPEPLCLNGQRLPASYANFYIGNAVVLVPTFNDPSDRRALGLLAELFPGRTVVGIHAVDLIWGLGALHCLTQQQPYCR